MGAYSRYDPDAKAAQFKAARFCSEIVCVMREKIYLA